MEAAMHVHTPHSVFALGRVWPNPDDPTEPYWLPLDREKAIAYLEWRSERCAKCGQHPHDWHDEHGIVLKDPPFEVVEYLCPSCELIEDHEDQMGADDRNGIHLAIARVD